MTTLRVEVGGGRHQVRVGATFEFGRNAGPGQIGDDDTTVSRVHGVIANHADRWEVSSVGSFVGLLIHDAMSSATVDVPAGVGPVGVPFRSALVVVPARRRHVLSVEAPHVTSPVADRSEPDASSLPALSDATERVVPESACFDRSGRPLRWFQVLVALCEPRLRGADGAAIPSDNEIRELLSMGTSAFDRAFARARSELGFEPYAPLVRLAMSTTAIHQGIVRPEHLALLARA